jgi:hypothetical protein
MTRYHPLGAFHPQARVVYISGFPDHQVRSEGIVTTPPTFLQKPFSLNDLAEAVAAALA